MPQVKCTVANCLFWDEGNNCGAEIILIDIDEHGEPMTKEEFAMEDFMAHQDTASVSSGTCCYTFEPRK